MDREIDKQEPSGKEGREMKAGDKVWVLCEVAMVYNHESLYVDIRHDGAVFEAKRSDCRPVEPDHDDHPVEFKVGDRVVSWSGRQGVVEAINEIEGFPITVRHSMREQVSYKLGGVKHDDHPVEPANCPEIPDSSSDPINPSHYKQGGIECIEAIKAALGEGFPDYLRGNVIKYLWRYKEKGGVEDLRKSAWYLDRLIKEVGE
jgi:hypothetical protein